MKLIVSNCFEHDSYTLPGTLSVNTKPFNDLRSAKHTTRNHKTIQDLIT